MWTAGLSLFTETDLKTKIKTLATHPCIWAVILGFAYSLVPLELPGFVISTVGALGSCTTALTMLAVGSILSEVELRGVLDKSCFYFSAIRLIAIPALFYGVLWLCGVDALVRGVITLSAAMPAATTTAMLSQKYDGDAAYAAKLIFVSTALSVVTLPIVGALIT
jgi:predicted permease